MHWGTAILSLEPIWEPPTRFKQNADKFGYKKEETIVFKIGEIKKLDELINQLFFCFVLDLVIELKILPSYHLLEISQMI